MKAASEHGFVQPQIVPVPDEFGPEMPRVIFSSQAGYTQLLISQISVTFIANYSEDWASDPERCLSYLSSKVDLLFDIARVGWRKTAGPSFAGITTVLRIPAPNRNLSVEMMLPFFAESMNFSDIAGEVSCRWSRASDDHFFNNISVQTFINVDEGRVSFKNGLPVITDDVIDSCGVEISGDFNDRLAFNSHPEYSTDAACVREMLTKGYVSAQDALRTIRKG
ncbi:hypothetical protein [Stenotrophomonas sp. SY1]|uniref:hypothetical protein n=1 Tax=Stenotrophomonas sp. SY1 TaxID=477235 RepID=UPI001E569704|nr:hypothetical protein [Stenotrophomonas sp. SY1]